MASCDPLRIYLYEDGLVRLATQNYSAPSEANQHNTFQHLTNYSINKNSPSFVKCGDAETVGDVDADEDRSAHKRSLLDFFKQLSKETGVDCKSITSQIEKIVAKTICSI